MLGKVSEMRLFGLLVVVALSFGCGSGNTDSISDGVDDFGDVPMECYFFFIPDCPASKLDMSVIMDLSNKYGSHGLTVRAIVSDPEPSDSILASAIENYNFTLPIEYDSTLAKAKSFGATTTPQVFLLNSSGDTVYSGQVNDYYYSYGKHRPKANNHYLEDAIISLLTNTHLEVSRTNPVGCKINYD